MGYYRFLDRIITAEDCRFGGQIIPIITEVDHRHLRKTLIGWLEMGNSGRSISNGREPRRCMC